MNFEEFSYKKDIISNIFPNRDNFRKKVEETLKWSDNGGPKVGTPSFLKSVIGGEKINQDEFKEINREIRKEVNNIKREKKDESAKSAFSEADESFTRDWKEEEKGKTFTEEERKRLVRDSELKELRELKRSGGIHPNDI